MRSVESSLSPSVLLSDDCRIAAHGPPVPGVLSLVPQPQPVPSVTEMVLVFAPEPAPAGFVPHDSQSEEDEDVDEDDETLKQQQDNDEAMWYEPVPGTLESAAPENDEEYFEVHIG